MPLTLLSQQVALSLSRPRLISLCDAFGWPTGPAAATRTSSRLEIARALYLGMATQEAKRQMTRFARFASPDGRRALREAAHVTGLPYSLKLSAQSSAEFAASLFFDRAGDDLLLKTLRRADLRLDRLLARSRSYELGARPIARGVTVETIERAVRKVHGDALLDIWTVATKTGAIHAAVIYLGWAEAQLAGDLGLLPARPWHVDLLRVAPKVGALYISSREPETTLTYSEAIGEEMAGDPSLYGASPSLTLKPLQELGDKGLRAIPLPEGVLSWSVVGCLWESIEDDARHEVRAPNALAALESKVQLDGGYFWRATFRAVVLDAPHALDIFVELPHRIQFSDPSYEPIGRTLLAALGVLGPGALPDDSYTLAPFLHAEWRYRELVGDALFEAMVKDKRLICVKTTRVATEPYRKFGRTFRTQPVPGEKGRHYAMCEDPMVPAIDVNEEDLSMWKLDVAKVYARMQDALGLTKPLPEERVKGVDDLGSIQVNAGRARVFFVMRRPDTELISRIRKVCKVGTKPLLLVPEGRRVSDGAMLEVGLTLAEQLGATSADAVRRRAFAALEIDDEVGSSRLPAKAADVVVVTRTAQVWVAGHLMRKLTEHTYRLVLCLATHAGETVSTAEIGKFLSPSSQTPDQVARKSRFMLVERVRASFEADGVVAPEELLSRLVVVDGRRGYRLGVSVKVVASL